ncbi:tyrosine-type recombinase/integrase [uncultured Duncaniella sp.]|nr:tyrosine-type recombinase/integrase [uncultured Duncaniella sp.]
MIKYQKFGEYLLSLSPTERAFSGRRVKVISKFIEEDVELSKPGYQEYLSKFGMDLNDTDRKYLCDFLYFSGVRRLGGARKPKGKVAEKIATITEVNMKMVCAFLEWAKKQRDYSVSSIRMKRDHMVKFFRYFSTFNLANCRDFIATMEHDGMSPKTLNMYMITLKQYGEYVKKPVTMRKISIPRSLSVENVPTEKEYQAFIQWLRDNEKWQMYWVVRILGSTGMRRSELNQLTWNDILSGDFFPLCKGKKRRMIYFPNTVVKELKEWLKSHPTDTSEKLIISKRFGKPLSDRGLDQILKNQALNAGFPKEKAHCHAFRHFFAKQYLAKTKDVIQLAELLGHESVDTTRLYLQKSKAEQARDINKYITW